ncbi:hypothetical protein [Ammonifex thiophilus]|uniref:Uncharacterized protein n=1 Tax=Ammonifex thiophilus TaxID=444093 RepID=A0A3D8P361_9THEO|nr:hypothetical protein [Ammonifex thiophilus]RDV81839.1 hypothetical protein DXX99_08680 [Ammonifex thiophilus]
MALEEILLKIRELSEAERRELLRELAGQKKLSEREAAERFDRAAGSWSDFDAEGFVREVYTRRASDRRLGVEW